MNTWYLEFQYDVHGHGELKLSEGNLTALQRINAHTGKVDVDGETVNKIKPGIWYVGEKSIVMLNKTRNYNILHLRTPLHRWSSEYHLTTWGCPVFSVANIRTDIEYFDCEELFHHINKILDKQEEIKFYINTPVPLEVKNGKS